MLYVNDEKIEDHQIQAEFDRLRPSYEQAFTQLEPEERQKQLWQWSQENIIERVLLRQAAWRDPEPIDPVTLENALQQALEQYQKLNPPSPEHPPDDDTLQRIKYSIEEQMRLERLMQKISANIAPPSAKIIQQFYEQNIDRYSVPETVHASHIVKHHRPDRDPHQTRLEMQKILDQLRQGADFAEMARQHSDCPENDGDLGFFTRGKMVQEFDEVVFNLQPNHISDLFQTEFGSHIATCHEKKPSIPIPLQDARDMIIRELTQQLQQESLEKFIDAEKERAHIQQK